MKEHLKEYGLFLVSVLREIPIRHFLRGSAIGTILAFALSVFGLIETPSIVSLLGNFAVGFVMVFNVFLFMRLYLDWREDARAPTTSCTGEPRPPAIARKILWLTVPREVIDAALGDLNEKFARLVREEGRPFAVVWYSAQTAGFCAAWVQRALERFLRFIKVTGSL